MAQAEEDTVSAEGKKNVIELRPRDRVMVRLLGRTASERDHELADPSRTKRKNAEAMTVGSIKPVRIGVRQRLAYDIRGSLDDGRLVEVGAVGGGQTFWLAR